MNLIFTQNNEKIIDEDAENFYELISKFINQKLIPSEDQLVLHSPKWGYSFFKSTIY